jgi:putative two-component system response regulator
MNDSKTRILVVEDNSAARELLVEYLLDVGEYSVVEAADATAGFREASSGDVDLVLLDVMLPDESGFNLCRRLKSAVRSYLPIILVTALNSVSDKVQGLEAGADDFLSKPIIREELLARTQSHLRTKRMMDKIEQYRQELSRFNQRLQEQVEIRTRQLQAALADLRSAKEEVEATRLEVIERLGTASEYRDTETGAHVRRMAEYVYETALAYGLPEQDAQLYKLAAPLHDIGKMGVGDHVLLKPTQLEEGEIELIRQHTVIGDKILSDPGTELLKIAQQMARSHHERWDGTGYPDGLSGESIPLSARICAVADVFDAITSARVYRSAPDSLEGGLSSIVEGAGTRFDPKVVTAFRQCFERISRVKEQSKEW